jgi:hypothetical protein
MLLWFKRTLMPPLCQLLDVIHATTHHPAKFKDQVFLFSSKSVM